MSWIHWLKCYGDKYVYAIGRYVHQTEALAFLKTAIIAYPEAYLVKIVEDKIEKI